MFSATRIIYRCQWYKMEDRAFNFNMHISKNIYVIKARCHAHKALLIWWIYLNNNPKTNHFISFEFISNHLKSVLTESISQINWNCISSPKKMIFQVNYKPNLNMRIVKSTNNNTNNIFKICENISLKDCKVK